MNILINIQMHDGRLMHIMHIHHHAMKNNTQKDFQMWLNYEYFKSFGICNSCSIINGRRSFDCVWNFNKIRDNAYFSVCNFCTKTNVKKYFDFAEIMNIFWVLMDLIYSVLHSLISVCFHLRQIGTNKIDFR